MGSKTVKSNRFPWMQVIGFFLSVALTFAAVGIAVRTELSYTMIVFFIFTLAVLQAVVQLIMFMHISEGEDGTWQIGKMISAAFFAFVIIAGTVWVLNSMH